MELTYAHYRMAADPSEVCGDLVACWSVGKTLVAVLADGLGHGIEAGQAAWVAVDYVQRHYQQDWTLLFHGMAAAMRSTRGAAVSLLSVDRETCLVRYAGIGNLRCAIFGWRTSHFDCDPGIVGGGFRRLSMQTGILRPGDWLAMWSDGLPENLQLPKPDPLVLTQFTEQAVRQQTLGRDDASLLAVCATADSEGDGHAIP